MDSMYHLTIFINKFHKNSYASIISILNRLTLNSVVDNIIVQYLLCLEFRFVQVQVHKCLLFVSL